MSNIGMPDHFGERIHQYSGLMRYNYNASVINDNTSQEINVIDNKHGFLYDLILSFAIPTNCEYFIVNAVIDEVYQIENVFRFKNKYLWSRSNSGSWFHTHTNFEGSGVFFSFKKELDFNKSVSVYILNKTDSNVTFNVTTQYKDYSV